MTLPRSKGRGGRPKGSTTRPQLRDFYSDKELEEFIKDLKKKAKTDTNIQKFVAEQIFGKAVQPIGNDDNKPFILQFDNAFTPKTKRDNTE